MENKAVSLIYVDIESGDWEGIYIDNKLYKEGHSLSPNVFTSSIGKYRHFESVSRLTLLDVQIEELGYSLPHKFEHVMEVVK
ncbi:hypothetical protein COE51_01540 [Bacillus pseudomycoides]|nr:hypothetical protein COE51_01540 [Bacillus pseudomycoides]